MSGGRIPASVGRARASLWSLSDLSSCSREKQNPQQVVQHRIFWIRIIIIIVFRDEGYNRSKSSRYGSDSIISGSSSIDRRSLGKSMDRKSSDSDYSGSGSRKSSSDRRLSASRHSLLSRGSDI